MKTILSIKGAAILGKKEQKGIIGGRGTSISCCGHNRCRISYPGGSFCEPGKCNSRGQCTFF